ncbi:BTAD domain-containing putative transcriptional regulator [Streptomyces californicus]|uniref:BTAD domain-containing putative transcriptional regulator n=1 Tax=Streptomyces californicus TaxID=67351 RepID=UPI0036B60636
MGRREKPIVTSNKALERLASWLRDHRAAGGWSYAQLAQQSGCHATTLQRAASGNQVPSARAVEAYARACGAPVSKALELWKQARAGEYYGVVVGRSMPSPVYVRGLGQLKAGLHGLYVKAGRPAVRSMEERAGRWGKLPHSTAHRIVQGQTVPRDESQLIGFLTACDVPEAEHPLWVDAWRRVLNRTAPMTALPKGAAPPAELAILASASEQRGPRKPEGISALRFTVLGPVRAWRGSELLSSGSPQQRALLAALLLREGRTATAGDLIDAFWGENPPSQALATIRTYASRLRKILGEETLVSESGGYALRIGRGELDLTLAQDLAVEAEKARAGGDRLQARTLINKVLGLWDGEALASVPGPYADNQRTRLEEWRLQLTEARLDLDLEVGSHAEAVSELTALTAAHPLRERLRELLMVALYRSGRQAEALAVYADTRRLLAEELGVDPRPELARLQQRILRADEELARPADEPAPAPAPLRPAQLPATVPDFIGRRSPTRDLGEHLATAANSVMAISALAGIGGVGKTTLAVHVAHQARRHFPDGQLYVDLQGAGARAAEPETVLGSFLRALGTADSAIPDTLDERAALYRSTLDGRRVLVLLDNAHDAAQIRPLLPGTPGCAALVTSRVRMVDLAGAHLVDLDVMSPEEALQLFTRIVGEERVGSEREAALDVVAACGFLPLAIRIAASRLAARRTWTVSVLAAKLADERRRLDELQAGDLAVKATFELSYRQLTPVQAQVFRALGTRSTPLASVQSVRKLLNSSPAEAEKILEDLANAGICVPLESGRYRLHDLAWLYARTAT